MAKNNFFSPGVGITMAIPTLGRELCMEWATSFKSISPPINYNMGMMIIKNQPVADARNMAVEHAMNENHRYLFFLGDDVVVPPDTLKRLIFRMEHDPSLGVVSGVYCSKSDPATPLIFKDFGGGTYWNWKIGDYFPVLGCGMDCALIRVQMLRELLEKDREKPWFKTVDEDQFEDAVNKCEMWTEDLYLCNRIEKETDYKVYIDGSILCDHWDHTANKFYNLPADSFPITQRMEKAKDLKQAIDLGCGSKKEELDGYQFTRFDGDEKWSPDYIGDIRKLPFATNSYDLVHSSHVLEHIPRKDFSSTIDEWNRILKEDGCMLLTVPDIGWASDKMQSGVIDTDVLNVLYGGQSADLDFHMNGFTEGRFKEELKRVFEHVYTYKRPPYNITAIASNSKESYDSLMKLLGQAHNVVERDRKVVAKKKKRARKKAVSSA